MTTFNSIREAEADVTATPVDSHKFARAATVQVCDGVANLTGLTPEMTNEQTIATLDALRAAEKEAIRTYPDRQNRAQTLLKEAGYTYDTDDNDNGWWIRDGFRAQAHGYEWGIMSIHIYRSGHQIAIQESNPESLDLAR